MTELQHSRVERLSLNRCFCFSDVQNGEPHPSSDPEAGGKDRTQLVNLGASVVRIQELQPVDRQILLLRS